MQETRYFSHAWALLARDRGWPKVIVMLALWMLIPIVGWLWVLGYEVEWARLIAWGAEGSPKQKNIDLGQCLTSGWRAFVAQFGWSALWAICYYLILLGSGSIQLYSFYPYVDVNPDSSVSLLADIVGLFYWVFLVIVGVRTAIYQSYSAGYQLNRIFDMLARDIGGFVKIVGINLLSALVSGTVIGVLGFFAGLSGLLGVGLLSYGITTETYHFGPVFFTLLVVVLYFLVVNVILLVLSLISYAMVGLWLRQFDVLSWGASKDPLPASPWLGHGGMPAQSGQAQVPQPGGQGQPQQPGQDQIPQQVFTMSAPAPMTSQADMGQNGSAPTSADMMPTSTAPVSLASPYPTAVPFGSSATTSVPTTDAPALSSPNSGLVDVTPLSGTSSPSNQGQADELASPVESILLDGGDLSQQVSQATDAKTFQAPEGVQSNASGESDQSDASDQTGFHAMGQEPFPSEAGGKDSVSGQP